MHARAAQVIAHFSTYCQSGFQVLSLAHFQDSPQMSKFLIAIQGCGIDSTAADLSTKISQYLTSALGQLALSISR